MSEAALNDILSWSEELSPWRRDCLRRLALSDSLSKQDYDELFELIRTSVGLDAEGKAPSPIPFAKEHYAGSKLGPITLKRLQGIQNINRLLSGATLEFCPKSLTVVYGRNGSGKSGFVRILRSACRTRIENTAKLRVLGNVYAESDEPQSAELVIDGGAGEQVVYWTPDSTAFPELSSVAVFDTQSAQLYVDGGSQIHFLPFGLALPHRLNTVSLQLKERLDDERAKVVGDKLSLTEIDFGSRRTTLAQSFNENLSPNTSTETIDSESTFHEEQSLRLEKLVEVLGSSAKAVADVSALITWLEALQTECEQVDTQLNDDALTTLTALKTNATEARKAAEIAADAIFSDDPLPGVGSETWRALWTAARNFSVAEAYPGQGFPVLHVDKGDAACVLCQQPLQEAAADRMERFRKYMDDALDAVARESEAVVSDASASIPSLETLLSADFQVRTEQVRKREETIAHTIEAFQKTARTRRAEALRRLANEPAQAVAQADSIIQEVEKLITELKSERVTLINSFKSDERNNLLQEKAEIEDQRTLSQNRERLVMRRDLLRKDAAYKKALGELQTKGITQKANSLLDLHLTKAVNERFNAERECFEISHLRVALARRSGKTKAEYEVDPQTKLTRVTSDILSEGEQRALAFASFLTEVALTEGSGPIIIDDPVSSLDRDRGALVAERIAEESTQRQVVVFTHDLVFFNELCTAAEDRGVEPLPVALFSDGESAGKIDYAGIAWKGMKVAKRIARLKNDSAALHKTYATSPTDYEVEIKNLYGRLRDTYERVIEEVIFHDIVRRGIDAIQTQKLRFVTLPDALAIRFHQGMSLANTHSHDNPSAETVTLPKPEKFKQDLTELETLISELQAAAKSAEASRPQMMPKK